MFTLEPARQATGEYDSTSSFLYSYIQVGVAQTAQTRRPIGNALILIFKSDTGLRPTPYATFSKINVDSLVGGKKRKL